MEKENEKNYCTLYLVRHGETEWNVREINQGHMDSFLTEKGIGQAKEIAERLKDVKFDAIFSSDLLRAQKTAEIIKFDRELVVQTSELLRERAHGSFEGKHNDIYRDMLKEKLEKREKLSGEAYESFRLAPGIETNGELMARFINQLREIAVIYPNKNVLVVTHTGCMKNFLIKIGYAKRKELLSKSVKNAAHVKIFSDGEHFFIKEVEGIEKTVGQFL